MRMSNNEDVVVPIRDDGAPQAARGGVAAPPAPAGGNGAELREERKEKLMKKEEEEKEAYSTLMDLLDLVEEKNHNAIYWIVFESVLILGLTAAMACTLTLERMKHNRFLGLRMWQYVMMAMVLFTGLSIIRFTTAALCWATKCWWRLHRDLGYFLKQIKTTVDVTIWLCAVLFAWYVWFRPRLKHVYGDVSIIAAHQITRFLIAVCLGAVLWLGKNVLFLWLEEDLHYRQLCDRITRTTLQLHVLQILHNYGMWRFLTHVEDRLKIQDLIDQDLKPNEDGDVGTVEGPAPKEGEVHAPVEKEEDVWMKGINICKELVFVRKETVPVLILKRLCKEYKNQTKLKPLPVLKETIQNPEDLMEEASKLFFRMKNPKGVKYTAEQLHSDENDEVKLEELEKKYKDVNRKELELFFRRFHGEKCLNVNGNRQNDQKTGRAGFLSSLNRLCCCVGIDDEQNEAQQEPTISDGKEKWKVIGRDDFCSWAVQAYRNCWGLESTLKSSEQIILKLNRMMIAFVLLLSLIIWLLLSEIVDSGQIALLFSPLLAAKFIFSESTKNMFDGLIFALAMHPFSPGDRVVIDGMELLVTEINILSTTFYKYQTREELVYPNSALATTQIINLELIPDQSDKLEFPIPNTTPLEDIRDLEIKIQMSLNERKDAFKSKVVKTEMGNENIKMTAHFNYVGSYLTSEVKAVHKSDMLSMIMFLVKSMSPSNENQGQPPSTCKPYIVDVDLNNRVKLKQVENIIKPAIKRSVGKHCEDHKLEHKIVMYNVAERRVWMAFYVWKKTDTSKEQELISLEDLAKLEACILLRIKNPDHVCIQCQQATGDTSVGSNKGLDVKEVNIQPKPGVLRLELVKGDVNQLEGERVNIKNTIKRYFYKQYFEDDFEVKIDTQNKTVEIYAWRKFSHDIEKENQFPMQQTLQQPNMKLILNKQLELKGVQSAKIQEVVIYQPGGPN